MMPLLKHYAGTLQRRKEWVALVDGNDTQLDLLRKGAHKHGLSLTIILDFIHVLEYLWKAAHELFGEGKPAIETWVRERALGPVKKSGLMSLRGGQRGAKRHAGA